MSLNREPITFDRFKERQGLLSGVWFASELNQDEFNGWQDAQVCYFMFDGYIYRIQEDPEDGYRSHHRDIEVCHGLMPVNIWEPSEPVWVRHVTRIQDEDYSSRFEACDVLEFMSQHTKKNVLVIGTLRIDDYYPSFTAHFDCRNLSHNQGVVDLIGSEQLSKGKSNDGG